jgi:lipoate---protein ligase
VIGDWDLDDELIVDVRASGRAAVHVYPHPGVAVVLGRGGRADVETRPEVIASDDVPLLRRRGGGCAVVLDRGNLVVAAAWPEPGVGGITSAFAAASEAVIAALGEIGVPGVHQAGVSDLALADRKLGGACIWRTRGLFYYATTLLVRPDWTLIDRYLPHPPREPEYRRGRAHRDFLTSLYEHGWTGSVADLAFTIESFLYTTFVTTRI